jgi:hypothetical protein
MLFWYLPHSQFSLALKLRTVSAVHNGAVDHSKPSPTLSLFLRAHKPYFQQAPALGCGQDVSGREGIPLA